MSGTLLYLYGFVPSGSEAPPAEVEGVGGRAVELHPLGAFDAVVSRVPDSEYESDIVEERLRDLDWVAVQGADHERVVTWFVDRSVILPARLLTLYRSPESLEAEAREREERVLATLDRFRGLHEWDLKISYDEEALARNLGELSAEVGTLDEEMQAAPPGRRYLLGRARGEKVREESARVARALAEEVLDAVRELARESVRIPPPRDAGETRVVANAALLVPDERRDELLRRMGDASERLEPKGLRMEFSGPWAPYRFLGKTT